MRDRLMGEVVFVLGAGFNRSILDPTRSKSAPLARNFFEVLMADVIYRRAAART
jgi:hypothetical protein